MHINDPFRESCKELFENENKWCLMQTIWSCARDNVPLPDWAAKAFIEAFESCRTGSKKSWDDLFDSPYPKGTHHKAVQKKHAIQWELFNSVQLMLKEKPETVIDNEFFTLVGKLFNIGRTLASEYYYEAKKMADRFS